MYGRCQERELFRTSFFLKPCLAHPNLIIGGDLNFSLGVSESWGANARANPLTDFFLSKIASSHLVDASLLKPRPTWRNKRVGEDWVGKKLDCFLLGEELAEKLSIFRHWVGEGGLLDHFPILLEAKGALKKLGSPFKFSSSWLSDDSFISLFHSTWRRDGSGVGECLSRSKAFMNNLKRLKVATKEWVIQKSLKENEEMRAINAKLDFWKIQKGKAMPP